MRANERRQDSQSLPSCTRQADPKLLADALRHLGLRLSVEQDQDLQSLVSAAFVRLSQEAAAQRQFGAMAQALDLLAGVESQRPGIARTLRAKMGIEERVPEFVEEALKAREVSAGLTRVLRQLPQIAMEQLSARFNRCQYRDDVEHVASLAHDLGEEALQYLRSTVRGGAVAEAVEMVGFWPVWIRKRPRCSFLEAEGFSAYRAGPNCAANRRKWGSGTLPDLAGILDHVDPLVMPLVVDEIGDDGGTRGTRPVVDAGGWGLADRCGCRICG